MRKENRHLTGIFLLIVILVLESMSAAFFFAGKLLVSAKERDTEVVMLSSDAPSEEFQQQSASQAEAIEAYNVLVESFGRDELLQPLYPEDYAGAYLDEEGNLNVLLTDLEGETRKECETLLAEWSHIIQYHKADYSYQQLSQIYEYIGTSCLDLRIVSYGISERENEAFVEVLEEDVEKLRERLKEEGAPAIPIRVEESEGIIVASGTTGETEQDNSQEAIEKETEEVTGERANLEKNHKKSLVWQAIAVIIVLGIGAAGMGYLIKKKKGRDRKQ